MRENDGIQRRWRTAALGISGQPVNIDGGGKAEMERMALGNYIILFEGYSMG